LLRVAAGGSFLELGLDVLPGVPSPRLFRQMPLLGAKVCEAPTREVGAFAL
jgi:hypothetical protein